MNLPEDLLTSYKAHRREQFGLSALLLLPKGSRLYKGEQVYTSISREEAIENTERGGRVCVVDDRSPHGIRMRDYRSRERFQAGNKYFLVEPKSAQHMSAEEAEVEEKIIPLFSFDDNWEKISPPSRTSRLAVLTTQQKVWQVLKYACAAAFISSSAIIMTRGWDKLENTTITPGTYTDTQGKRFHLQQVGQVIQKSQLNYTYQRICEIQRITGNGTRGPATRVTCEFRISRGGLHTYIIENGQKKLFTRELNESVVSSQ